MGKDRAHGLDFINLYLGRRNELMEPQEVQIYSHTPGTQKTIRRTNFVCINFLQVMSETGTDSTRVGKNIPTEAPQVATVVQVLTSAPSITGNVFMETLKGILGFTITQVRFLVEN